MRICKRKHVFETNSSSCHSVVICSRDKYRQYLNGELVIVHDTVDFGEYQDNIVDTIIPDSSYYDLDSLYDIIKKNTAGKKDEEGEPKDIEFLQKAIKDEIRELFFICGAYSYLEDKYDFDLDSVRDKIIHGCRLFSNALDSEWEPLEGFRRKRKKLGKNLVIIETEMSVNGG